jgi:hypothetical protein
MDENVTTRALTAGDRAVIDAELHELREHFHEWSSDDPCEHSLIEFAIYEGCVESDHCRDVLRKAAPFALGKELVEKDGFEWVMLQVDGGWHHAVTHPSLDTPVDLATIENGSWNREQYDEVQDPARIVNESYGALSATARRASPSENFVR